MFDKTLGFIGGGRIVRILLGGWQRAGVTFPAVVVSDTNADALQRLSTLSTGLQAAAGAMGVACHGCIILDQRQRPGIH